MKRKRVDWDEELKKSEKIRRRGFFYTLGGFSLALFWILGARQMQRHFAFGPLVILLFFVAAGTFLFTMVARRRKNKER